MNSNMGTNQSSIEKKRLFPQYNLKYNLIPSHSGHEFDIISMKDLGNKLNVLDNNESKYIDLRNEFPNILNTLEYPFNPIACVSYLIQYSMIQTKLPIFQPSLMFIYKNIAMQCRAM